jgi:hypothetical protein
MDDFTLYSSGRMNPDEQAQWEHVSEMMAEAGECDGYGPAQEAYDRAQGDYYAGDYEVEEHGPFLPGHYVDDEIPF